MQNDTIDAGGVSSADEDDNDRDYLQTLSRGLAVIRAFGPDSRKLSLANAADRTGLSRSVVRRCLRTLVRDGYATTDGRLFSLSARILELGYAFLSSIPFEDVAQPVVDDLARRTGLSCGISVLDGEDAVFVHTARPSITRVLTLSLHIGSRFPAFASANGRVLLTQLAKHELDDIFKKSKLRKLTEKTIVDPDKLVHLVEQARSNGWLVGDGEVDAGILSLAVPILDASGRAFAALNVAQHTSLVSKRQFIEENLSVLQDAARRLSTASNGSGHRR